MDAVRVNATRSMRIGPTVLGGRNGEGCGRRFAGDQADEQSKGAPVALDLKQTADI